MKQLIISDIDGTLLDEYAELPPANSTALMAAAERGVRLALATIRKRDSTEMIARLIGTPCTMACEGGALIYDETGTVLRALTIPLELARTIATLADDNNIPLVTTINEINYYTVGSHPQIRMVAKGVDVENNLAALIAPPTRLIVRGAVGANILLERFRDQGLRIVRHYAADGTLNDAVLTVAEATKEGALAFLCRRWGIDPANVLALGDSESDIGMIRMAGVGVAMANAHHEVRAAADWVAPRADEAGVAAAVQRYILNGN